MSVVHEKDNESPGKGPDPIAYQIGIGGKKQIPVEGSPSGSAGSAASDHLYDGGLHVAPQYSKNFPANVNLDLLQSNSNRVIRRTNLLKAQSTQQKGAETS